MEIESRYPGISLKLWNLDFPSCNECCWDCCGDWNHPIMMSFWDLRNSFWITSKTELFCVVNGNRGEGLCIILGDDEEWPPTSINIYCYSDDHSRAFIQPSNNVRLTAPTLRAATHRFVLSFFSSTSHKTQQLPDQFHRVSVTLQQRHLQGSTPSRLPHSGVEGILKHWQFPIHPCYASLRIDTWETIEGNQKWQSHTMSSTCLFLLFKD